MEFNDLVRRRSMIRSFRPDPVPEELVQKLLRNAIRAPSAGHLQPWEFIVVRDGRIKERLAEAALGQMFIAQAPVVIVTCRNLERNAWRYGDRGRHFYSLIDTAFASLIILLTARNEGLGACFVGAYRDTQVWKILGLPDHVRSVGIIPIGWPAEEPIRAERIPLPEVVHWERFGNTAKPAEPPP